MFKMLMTWVHGSSFHQPGWLLAQASKQMK
jgi:hypothetical protein